LSTCPELTSLELEEEGSMDEVQHWRFPSAQSCAPKLSSFKGSFLIALALPHKLTKFEMSAYRSSITVENIEEYLLLFKEQPWLTEAVLDIHASAIQKLFDNIRPSSALAHLELRIKDAQSPDFESIAKFDAKVLGVLEYYDALLATRNTDHSRDNLQNDSVVIKWKADTEREISVRPATAKLADRLSAAERQSLTIFRSYIRIFGIAMPWHPSVPTQHMLVP
jgi:hypothetical protein